MEESIERFEHRKPYEEFAVTNVSDQSPAAMIQMAIARGADLEKLEKLMALQERFERNEAKKAYVDAMAAFKSNPPEIHKDRKVSYKAGAGITEYSHASLANVTDKINTALSAHGLSAAWTTFQENGSVTVTCTITHKFGHSESTSLTAQPDTSGSKNPIQAIGSTVSYLERYTILALTGLATFDMDDDGKTAANEYINEDQIIEINDLIKEKKVDKDKFLKFAKAESVETILASNYKTVINALKEKK